MLLSDLGQVFSLDCIQYIRPSPNIIYRQEICISVKKKGNSKWKKANKQLLMSNIHLRDHDLNCVRATEGENGCCYWIGITSNQSDRWVLESCACFHVPDGLECECAYWSGRGAMFDGAHWNARCVFISVSIDSAFLAVCRVSVCVGRTHVCGVCLWHTVALWSSDVRAQPPRIRQIAVKRVNMLSRL